MARKRSASRKGRDSRGRLEKGYHLLKGGRVVKAKKKRATKKRRSRRR